MQTTVHSVLDDLQNLNKDLNVLRAKIWAFINAAYHSEHGVDEKTHINALNLIEVIEGEDVKNTFNMHVDATDGFFYFKEEISAPFDGD